MYTDYVNIFNSKKPAKKSNNKVLIIIIFLIIILLITGVILIRQINNNQIKSHLVFQLLGSEYDTVYQYENYNESSFVAFYNSVNIMNNVVINNEINTDEVGNYRVLYTLRYKGYKKTLIRYVTVKENPIREYTLSLIGDRVIYLPIDTEYKEVGYEVKDTNNNTVSFNVIVSGSVDNTVPGKYVIGYTIKYQDLEKTITREVIVYDIKYELNINPIVETKNKVGINIKIDNDSKYYAYILLPNGKKTSAKDYTYWVEDNNDYTFQIYDIMGYYHEKIITIDNINKYECEGIINDYGTILSINGNSDDNIIKYVWAIDNNVFEGSSAQYIYRYKMANNAKVTMTFNDGSSKKTDCMITNNLIYRFVYDEYNTKEYMQCNTYTASDKIYYDELLRKAVEEAGYGTRAGVVAAARFLVGGLSYKVPYLGPKTVDSSLGRYNKVGLNIGQEDAWGCSVSGHIQGIDCTNFVSWAFKQNGLMVKNIYGTQNTYSTSSVARNGLQVGDFLLNPSGDTFSHVALVIGLDESYIYVAEASNGSVKTTKIDMSTLSSAKRLTVARLYKYDSEGNVTEMWVS